MSVLLLLCISMFCVRYIPGKASMVSICLPSVQTCKECFKKLEYEVLMVNLLSGGDFLKLFHLKKYKDMPQNLYKQRLISAELRL